MPKEIGFVNQQFGDKELKAFIAKTYKNHGPAVAVRTLDSLKDMGFKYATIFGATIGPEDIVIPAEKKKMIEAANAQVENIQNQYLQGHITQEERYNRVVEVRSKTNEDSPCAHDHPEKRPGRL
jgi:DNA-directed RNA polymerase subunit beta'